MAHHHRQERSKLVFESSSELDLWRRRRQRVHAELARVLYVAMTRARDCLYIMDAMPCEQDRAYARNGSLQHLLQRAKQCNAAAFDRLMPTVQLQVADGQEHAVKQKELSAVDAQRVRVSAATCQACTQGPVALSRVGTLRLTPSQLAHACNKQGLRKTPRVQRRLSNDEDPARLGRLTHALLAAVSLQLAPGGKLDAKNVDSWLRCAIAAAGIQSDEPQAQQAVQLARCTLLGPLGQVLSQATWVNFEHAVAYQMQGVVVEGYADLVLQGPWGVGIVDFKLSAHTAALQATRVQLYAYAQAFAQENSSQSIWVAASVLGSEEPLVRLPYNAQAKSVLEKAVQLKKTIYDKVF
ncbi:MAG: PD-(D/E)XK nuclease family protein [Myxococcota bacterium]